MLCLVLDYTLIYLIPDALFSFRPHIIDTLFSFRPHINLFDTDDLFGVDHTL